MRTSVVICTYNGEKYIKAQIESILKQSVPVNEILVLDDGSIDRTLEFVESVLKDNAQSINYRIVKNPFNLGVTHNFLNGLKISTGELVFTADQDDIWLSDKVEQFITAYNNSHKMLYFSDGIITDSEGRPKGFTLWESRETNVMKIKPEGFFNVLLKHYIVTGSAMAVSRKLIEKIDYIPQYWVHDAWLALVASCYDSVEAIDKKTYFFRRHDSNVTTVVHRNSANKIKSWISNVQLLSRSRIKSYNRFIEAYLNIELSEEKKKELSKCVHFWEELKSLSNVNCWEGMRIITTNFLQGNYFKYYTGVRGALRDYYSVLHKHKQMIES